MTTMNTQQPTTSTAVPTSTAHPGIERASAHLAAVLVGNGNVDAVLSSSEMILRLADVTPPLPPLTYPTTGPSDLPGIRAAVIEAITELVAVADDGDDLNEALRAGHGAHLLRELLTRLEAAEHAAEHDGRTR